MSSWQNVCRPSLILSMCLCQLIEGKKQWLILLKRSPYSVNGFTADMLQTPQVTWLNTSAGHTLSLPHLFTLNPAKKNIVTSVELNSFWTIHMQCTSSTPTTVVLNVIIVMNIFLDVRVSSLKFTWDCAHPRVVVIPIAIALGQSTLRLKFNLTVWLVIL